MDPADPHQCAQSSQAGRCVASCFLMAPGSHAGQLVWHPEERAVRVEKVFVEVPWKGRAAWWQSQRLTVSPGKHDRVWMRSKSQAVFTGGSAGDKQFTTTSSIVLTI
uniref:Uncharacterized protein n=1 Tax=Propithecus coquereli TaxID=379532 RepID=A0A2K6FGR2_PROCO